MREASSHLQYCTLDYGASLLNALISRLLSVIDNLTPFTIAKDVYNLRPWPVFPALLSPAFPIM